MIFKRVLNKFKPYANHFYRKSYSQAGEDQIIRFIFNELKIEKPTYIDIGAHHPYYLNNCQIFYETGSRGINIEPNPDLFKLFNKYRRHDINLNIGIGPSNDTLEYFMFDAATLNTFSKKSAEETIKMGYKLRSTTLVPVVSLNNIIDQNNSGIFPDLLSLDIEGDDDAVLRSIDYEYNFPKVICVETITFGNREKNLFETEAFRFLYDNGYMLFGDTLINSIFVKKSLWL